MAPGEDSLNLCGPRPGWLQLCGLVVNASTEPICTTTHCLEIVAEAQLETWILRLLNGWFLHGGRRDPEITSGTALCNWVRTLTKGKKLTITLFSIISEMVAVGELHFCSRKLLPLSEESGFKGIGFCVRQWSWWCTKITLWTHQSVTALFAPLLSAVPCNLSKLFKKRFYYLTMGILLTRFFPCWL